MNQVKNILRIKWLKPFIWIVTRAVIVYIAVIFIANSTVDHNRVQFGLKIRLLNHMMPYPFRNMIDVLTGIDQVDKSEFKRYKKFYARVIQFFPERADAFSMLGFCSYHLENTKEAVAFYNKAVTLDPDIFWFYYNLGLIYYEQGRYKEAAEYFDQAVIKDPNDTIKFIQASKVIYRSILMNSLELNEFTAQRIISGYLNSHILVTLSHYYEEDYQAMFQSAIRALRLKLKDKDEFYYYTALSLYNLSNYEKAFQFLSVALKRDLKNYDVYYLMSQTLEKMGKADQSSEALNLAQSLKETKGVMLKTDHISLQAF